MPCRRGAGSSIRHDRDVLFGLVVANMTLRVGIRPGLLADEVIE
jgi:hypothetical protein